MVMGYPNHEFKKHPMHGSEVCEWCAGTREDPVHLVPVVEPDRAAIPEIPLPPELAARLARLAEAAGSWGTPEKPANIFLVGAQGERLVFYLRPAGVSHALTKGEALNLAAWLVALADESPDAPMFHALLRGVWST